MTARASIVRAGVFVWRCNWRGQPFDLLVIWIPMLLRRSRTHLGSYIVKVMSASPADVIYALHPHRLMLIYIFEVAIWVRWTFQWCIRVRRIIKLGKIHALSYRYECRCCRQLIHVGPVWVRTLLSISSRRNRKSIFESVTCVSPECVSRHIGFNIDIWSQTTISWVDRIDIIRSSQINQTFFEDRFSTRIHHSQHSTVYYLACLPYALSLDVTSDVIGLSMDCFWDKSIESLLHLVIFLVWLGDVDAIRKKTGGVKAESIALLTLM